MTKGRPNPVGDATLSPGAAAPPRPPGSPPSLLPRDQWTDRAVLRSGHRHRASLEDSRGRHSESGPQQGSRPLRNSRPRDREPLSIESYGLPCSPCEPARRSRESPSCARGLIPTARLPRARKAVDAAGAPGACSASLVSFSLRRSSSGQRGRARCGSDSESIRHAVIVAPRLSNAASMECPCALTTPTLTAKIRHPLNQFSDAVNLGFLGPEGACGITHCLPR